MTKASTMAEGKLEHQVPPSSSRRRQKSDPCSECGKVFRNSTDLLRHIRTHTREKPYVCPQCGKAFSQAYNLKTQMITHTGKPKDRRLECSHCSRYFRLASELRHHMKEHEGERQPPTCTLCDKTFDCNSSLKRHMLKHSDVRPHGCSHCSRKFKTVRNLKKHIPLHTGEWPHVCPACGKGCSQLSDLKRHKKTHEISGKPNEKIHICEHCKRRYKTKESLQKHMERNHEKAVCHQGENIFSSQDNLEENMSEHSGEKEHSSPHMQTNTHDPAAFLSRTKEYKCDMCAKKFFNPYGLEQHKLTHTREKSHACPYCQKRFALRPNLKRHVAGHPGEWAHQCPQCGKGCASKAAIKIHMYTHKGGRLHNCSQCGQRFAHVAHLKAHMAKHAGEKCKTRRCQRKNKYTCLCCREEFTRFLNLKAHDCPKVAERPTEDMQNDVLSVPLPSFDFEEITLSHQSKDDSYAVHTFTIDSRQEISPDIDIFAVMPHAGLDPIDDSSQGNDLESDGPPEVVDSIRDSSDKDGLISPPNVRASSKFQLVSGEVVQESGWGSDNVDLHQEEERTVEEVKSCPGEELITSKRNIPCSQSIHILDTEHSYAKVQQSVLEPAGETGSKPVPVDSREDIGFLGTGKVNTSFLGPTLQVNLCPFEISKPTAHHLSRALDVELSPITSLSIPENDNGNSSFQGIFVRSEEPSEALDNIRESSDDGWLISPSNVRASNKFPLVSGEVVQESGWGSDNVDLHQEEERTVEEVKSCPGEVLITSKRNIPCSQTIHIQDTEHSYAKVQQSVFQPPGETVSKPTQVESRQDISLSKTGMVNTSLLGPTLRDTKNPCLFETSNSNSQHLPVTLDVKLSAITSLNISKNDNSSFQGNILRSENPSERLDTMRESSDNDLLTSPPNVRASNKFQFVSLDILEESDLNSDHDEYHLEEAGAVEDIEPSLGEELIGPKRDMSCFESMHFYDIKMDHSYAQVSRSTPEVVAENAYSPEEEHIEPIKEAGQLITNKAHKSILQSLLEDTKINPCVIEIPKTSEAGKKIGKHVLLLKPEHGLFLSNKGKMKSPADQHKNDLRTKTQEKPSQTLLKHYFRFSYVSLETEKQEQKREDKPPYTCLVCGKTLISLMNLERHKQIHTEANPFLCSKCGKRFRNKTYLNNHMRSHSDDRPHECPQCKMRFKTKTHMKRHMHVHTGAKPHLCSQCGKRFRWKCALKSHTRLHTGQWSHTCRFCGKGYPSMKGLQNHMSKHMHTVERPFTCTECGLGFSLKRYLSKHMEKHASGQLVNKKTYECPCCDETFPSLCEVKKHTCTQASGKPPICPTCSQECKDPFALLLHIISHHKSHNTLSNEYKKSRNECSHCKENFHSEFLLKSHVYTHTGVKPFVCSICEKGFITNKSHKMHLKTHNGGSPQVCADCGQKCKSLSSLRRHRSIACVKLRELQKEDFSNTAGSPLNCPQCQRVFFNPNSLKQHVNDHANHKLHLCPHCGKGYGQPNQLKSHLVSHTGEKPHGCSLCPKRYANAKSLKLHMFSHTGEKPHECSQCKERFTTASRLKTHMYTHTGEKPYVCSIGQKSFTRAKALASHLQYHKEGTPHACSYCGKAYKLTTSLRRHILLRHWH